MIVWLQKAIEIAPELRSEFQDPDLSLYLVFGQFLSLLRQAHSDNDINKVQKIYDFAEWCFRQKVKKLWNAAGVSFYEHLGDSDILFSEFPKWVKKSIYLDIRDLLSLRLDDKKMQQLDKHYGITKIDKSK